MKKVDSLEVLSSNERCLLLKKTVLGFHLCLWSEIEDSFKCSSKKVEGFVVGNVGQEENGKDFFRNQSS